MTIRRYPTKTFTPCPVGLHQAVCVDVVDLGDQPTQFGIKPQVRLVWQIAEVNPETLRRYDVVKTCTDSMAPKATFRKLVESWRGTHLTEAEAKAFDSDRLIGANCQLQVSQGISEKSGDIYAAVDMVLPPVKGTDPLKPLAYVRRSGPHTDPTAAAVASPTAPPPAAPAAAALTVTAPPRVRTPAGSSTTPPHESDGLELESDGLEMEFDEPGAGDADWDIDFVGPNDGKAKG